MQEDFYKSRRRKCQTCKVKYLLWQIDHAGTEQPSPLG